MKKYKKLKTVSKDTIVYYRSNLYWYTSKRKYLELKVILGGKVIVVNLSKRNLKTMIDEIE